MGAAQGCDVLGPVQQAEGFLEAAPAPGVMLAGIDARVVNGRLKVGSPANPVKAWRAGQPAL
jgi:hypothetical protein